MCLEILTQGRSPLLSVKISLLDVFKQLLTLHKLTPTSDATSKHFSRVQNVEIKIQIILLQYEMLECGLYHGENGYLCKSEVDHQHV